MTGTVEIKRGFSAPDPATGAVDVLEVGEHVEYAHVEKLLGKGVAKHYLDTGRIVAVGEPIMPPALDTLNDPRQEIHLSAPPAVPVPPGQELPEGVSASIPALPADADKGGRVAPPTDEKGKNKAKSDEAPKPVAPPTATR
jgi:hypothetical protein